MLRHRFAVLLLLALPFALTACDSDDPAAQEPFGITEVTLLLTDDRGLTRTFVEVIGDDEDPPTIEVIPDASYSATISFRNANASDPEAPDNTIRTNVDTYQVIYEITGDLVGFASVRYNDSESQYDLGQQGDDLAVGLRVTIEGGEPTATTTGFLKVEVFEYESGSKRSGVPSLDSKAEVIFPVIIPIL